eukprot:gene10715-12449_t
MFARADRTFLYDVNRSRFAHSPPSHCNEPAAPGRARAERSAPA